MFFVVFLLLFYFLDNVADGQVHVLDTVGEYVEFAIGDHIVGSLLLFAFAAENT